MLSASKIALTPELAVQSDIARLTRKLTPRVAPPCDARRVISSRRRSIAPPGATFAIVSRWLATVAGSANRPKSDIKAAIPGKIARRIECDAGGDQQDAVFRNA